MSKGRTQIPWDEKLECILLNLVIVKGAHLAATKDRGRIWNVINDDFFLQGETQHLKEDHYKESDPRKLRDKVRQIQQQVMSFMETGNKSKYDGDTISEKFRLCKQIIDEKAEKEEDDKAEKERKEKLKKEVEACEKAALGEKRPRDSGSSKEGSMKRPATAPTDFEGSLLEMLNGDKNGGEEKMEIDMLRWIEERGETESTLLAEAGIYDEDTVAVVNDLTLATVISIYCARGENFAAKPFKEELEKMDLKPIARHKLYNVLNVWRRSVMQEREAVVSLKEEAKRSSPLSTSSENNETDTPIAPLVI